TTKIDATSSSDRICCWPGVGEADGVGAVLNVYVSCCPDVVCVAEVKRPPVFERLSLRPDPDVAPDWLSLDGWVRNANASFSLLKGTVISAPDSSPSVTDVTFPPAYVACSLVFAVAMSEALRPDIEAPLLSTSRAAGRGRGSRQAREPQPDRRLQGQGRCQPRQPPERWRAEPRRDRRLDGQPRPVGGVRVTAVWGQRHHLRAGLGQPR